MAAGEEKKGEMKEQRRGKKKQRRERNPGDTSAAVQVVSYPFAAVQYDIYPKHPSCKTSWPYLSCGTCAGCASNAP